MTFYSYKRIIISILLSVGVFIVVASGTQSLVIAIFAAFLTHAILIPNILWNFILDRARELGKALRGEE